MNLSAFFGLVVSDGAITITANTMTGRRARAELTRPRRRFAILSFIGVARHPSLGAETVWDKITHSSAGLTPRAMSMSLPVPFSKMK